MIRKKRYLAAKMGLLALGLMLLFPGQAEAADKKTIYNSPYVSFSPDGKAFTTCAGDQNYTWYAEDDSTTVYTGIKSSLRSLRTGEHYYKVARWGEVPVGSWKVVHRPGQCIHDGYTSDENWHGIQFGTQKCMQYYYSGWKAFCADCGEPLEDSNIYMSREAASSIQYLDLGSEKNPVFYYYLCPFCRNLEQGVGLSAHWCKEISWNQYRVVYKAMGVQKFTISRDLSGQTIQVIPVAEADKESDKVYSAHELDEKNKITLIADGEAPVIRGLEIMEDRDLIDRRDGSITVTVTADDDLSGVKDFYVVIKNTDNAITKTYLPDVDGSIRITITEDEPIFSGDFTVLGYAVDNVGNENNLSYGTTEFALASSVERILSPHDPIFKCGESGILTFTTWGYADRVEVIFPESMTALDPTLNKVYDYTDCPGYMITEHLQFMVPLYTPENQNLEITVRAYKGDKKLEDHPTISVIGVSGTVLDEFRTRLR